MARKEFKHPIWEELHKILQKTDKLTRAQIMYFVRLREQFQRSRKAGYQILEKAKGEKLMVGAFASFSLECEKELEYLFKGIVKQDPVCVWASSILGVGNVFSCSLRAYIDMEETEYAGRIWKFAGFAPGYDRPVKNEKLAYCKRLKSICFLIGESFKKLNNNPRSFYGAMYKRRKLYEMKRNDKGGNKEAAATKLKECKIGKKTDAYKAYITGILPPAHLDMRAIRWTAKLFLAHWFHTAYRHRWNCEPPMPYVIQNLGHSGMITVDDVMAYENPEDLGELESVA